MKKRIFSLLIVLVMLFPTTPVFADNQTHEINSVDDLFALNSMLNSNAVLNTDLELVIDETFVQRYGASSIGESSPYTGRFNGNNHTITIDVKTDKKSYGLFHYLNGATVGNLNIVVKNFYTSSTSSNISFSGLAHIVRDTNINASVVYAGNQNGGFIFEPGVKHRNVTIGSIAANCGGTNKIYIMESYMNLTSVPEDSSIVFGPAAVISDGQTTIISLDENSSGREGVTHAFVSVPAKLNSYVIGGIVGEVKSGATAIAKGDGKVSFVKHGGEARQSVNGLKTIIGGNIGLINEGALGTVTEGSGNYVTINLHTFGYASEFTVGGYVGQNDGNVNVNHSSSSLVFNEDVVKFANDASSNGSVVNIGGILGKNTGLLKNHSTAVNNTGSKIDAGNATVNLGSILGYNAGRGIVESYNNGISLQVEDMKCHEDSSFGYMIGKVENSENVNVAYNIINAVDEQSFKADYDWIEHPFGGLNENARVEGFKNNYWGYMDYAEIGKPSQIYFMIPMNYFGDNPPEMEDRDFPFLAVYGYLDYSDINNRYLTFQNKSGNGIGTLTLTQDCVVGTRIKIDVVNGDALPGWNGHYYLYDDILGKLDENKKDEKDEEDLEDEEDEDNQDEEESDDDDLEEENPEDKDDEEEDKKDHDSKDDEYFGPEEYLRDFNQAVITDENGKGEPLPTFNDVESSDVKFNYHELNYEFVKNNIVFDDIKGEKYRRDIIQAANRLIVRGVGDNKFEPSRPITRAEFAAMVVRALGLLPIGDPEFEDVTEDKWYYDYVNAAASWEIIYGVGDNKYEPEDDITREEAMLILTRAAENIVMKNNFECILKDNSSFIANDTDDFSDWAYEGYRDNLKYGIVSMRTGYKSAPTEPITRAETANAILNLLRNFALIDYTR